MKNEKGFPSQPHEPRRAGLRLKIAPSVAGWEQLHMADTTCCVSGSSIRISPNRPTSVEKVLVPPAGIEPAFRGP